MNRGVVCHGWQATDLAHENISSALSLLGVTISAIESESTNPEDLARSLHIISNLLKGSLPVLGEDFPAQPHSLVLGPSEVLLKAS